MPLFGKFKFVCNSYSKQKKGMLPCQLQNRFQERIGGYKLKEELNFKVTKHRTTMKSFGPTVNGVPLWNGFETELKKCSDIGQFKYKYKQELV